MKTQQQRHYLPWSKETNSFNAYWNRSIDQTLIGEGIETQTTNINYKPSFKFIGMISAIAVSTYYSFISEEMKHVLDPKMYDKLLSDKFMFRSVPHNSFIYLHITYIIYTYDVLVTLQLFTFYMYISHNST